VPRVVMVPEEGVEPTRPCDQRILSPRTISPKSLSFKHLRSTLVPLWYQLWQTRIRVRGDIRGHAKQSGGNAQAQEAT
jgi:hypothetical protein